MTQSYDVIVLGGGPAGVRAAIAARRQGLTVAVIDEGRRPGGQVYRAPNFTVSAADLDANPDLVRGERLRADFAGSGAELFARHRAWFAAPGIKVSAAGPEGATWFESRALILATGTSERAIPVPGITLPGVIGLAAATVLLKAHGAVPGSPTLVAGVGPLLYAVATSILKHGGQVAAVVDLSRPGEWAAALPGMISRPDLLARGLGWMLSLKRAGIPIHHGSTVTAIRGDVNVQEVEICPVDGNWAPIAGARRKTIAAKGVAIGHGLTPASEFARILAIPHRFSAERGGWIPTLAPDRKAMDGVYIAGDCAGISGAAAAEIAGTLAGLSAARDLGALTDAKYAELALPVSRSLARAERFGWTISKLMSLRPGLARAIASDTVVCRCEDVARETIDDAAKAGATHVNQLKSLTRCGMGPCQGRSCGEAAAEIMAADTNTSREAVGAWTARTPLRPLPLDVLLGSYVYEDILKPPPLPA